VAETVRTEIAGPKISRPEAGAGTEARPYRCFPLDIPGLPGLVQRSNLKFKGHCADCTSTANSNFAVFGGRHSSFEQL
jgi:hypothetical protein